MEYRIFVPGADAAAVLKLRANVWGAEHPHSTPQFLHWLLGDTPAGAGSGVMMLYGQEVVGFAGLLPRRVEIGSESLAVAQCVDYMVHAQARSRAGSFRIMSIWAQLAHDLGFAFGIGFPNASAHKVVTRSKLGWREAFWPALMVRPLSGAAVPDFLARWGSARLLRYGTGVAAKLTNARTGWSLRRRPRGEAFLIDHFDSRFEDLWQRARAGSLSGIRRDAAYLNWRFVRQPSYSYLRVGWKFRGEVLGYAVASPREVLGVPSMLLVDLLAAPDAASHVAEALLEEVVHRAEAQSSHVLQALAVDGSPMQAVLRRAGFVTVPRRFNPKPFVMTVHDLGASNNLPAFLADWHFSWGDMDVV